MGNIFAFYLPAQISFVSFSQGEIITFLKINGKCSKRENNIKEIANRINTNLFCILILLKAYILIDTVSMLKLLFFPPNLVGRAA